MIDLRGCDEGAMAAGDIAGTAGIGSFIVPDKVGCGVVVDNRGALRRGCNRRS
jgi:hypothetical protein